MRFQSFLSGLKSVRLKDYKGSIIIRKGFIEGGPLRQKSPSTQRTCMDYPPDLELLDSSAIELSIGVKLSFVIRRMCLSPEEANNKCRCLISNKVYCYRERSKKPATYS